MCAHRGYRDGLKRSQGNFRRRWVVEGDMLKLHRGSRDLKIVRSGFFVNHGLEIKDFKHPIKTDQSCHHVDAHIGQRGQWSIQLRQQRRQGDQVPQRQRLIDDQNTTDAIDQSRSQRRYQRQRSEKDPVSHRDLYANVTHSPRFERELIAFFIEASKKLDQESAGNVEAFSHHRAH
ncbi:unannotated protein [freshwater metagenome]|uniref:Unannotated protein n=1 Tax=freshwater metagenome TaxID=449393 RepID=A0A6J6XYZ9_9ZZZZ